MAQHNPLEDQLLAQAGGQVQPTQPVGAAPVQGEPQVQGGIPGQGGTSQALRQIQTQGDPTEEFLISLIELAESKGMDMDEIMGQPPSVEDQLDEQDPTADPAEFLSREEMEAMMQKFEAMPPEAQQGIMQQLQAEAPEMFQRIQAIMRMLRGSGGVV